MTAGPETAERDRRCDALEAHLLDEGLAGRWSEIPWAAHVKGPHGPRVRAVPVDLPADHPAAPGLRWPTCPEPAAPKLGEARRHQLAFAPATDTVRLLAASATGVLAIGTEHEAGIWNDGHFVALDFPGGARRETKEADALAWHGDELVLAAKRATWRFSLSGQVLEHAAHPPDEDGVYDEVRALWSDGRRRLVAWRTRLEGGAGPADVLALAADPSGVVFAGTRAGEIHVVDGGGPIRSFSSEAQRRERAFAGPTKRPVRHLAFAHGHLYVAAADALHRFDGVSWSSEPGEPTALLTDDADRLWLVRDGRIHWRTRGSRGEGATAITRPWSIAHTPGRLWVGSPGALWELELS